PTEIFVFGHVADAENKNAETDQRDHQKHRGRKRIENETNPQSLLPESEPRKILDRAEAVRMERRHKREDRHRQGRDLSENRDRGSCSPGRFSESQNQERHGDRRRRNQPNVVRNPGIHPLRRSSWSTLVLRKWRETAMTMARPTAASAAAMAMAKIATIMPVGCAGCGANRQNAMKLMFAAASIISIPIKMKMACRRLSAASNPMQKSAAETMSKIDNVIS